MKPGFGMEDFQAMFRFSARLQEVGMFRADDWPLDWLPRKALWVVFGISGSAGLSYWV